MSLKHFDRVRMLPLQYHIQKAYMFMRIAYELVDEEVNELRRVQWPQIDSPNMKYSIIHRIVSAAERKTNIHAAIQSIGADANINRLNHHWDKWHPNYGGCSNAPE